MRFWKDVHFRVCAMGIILWRVTYHGEGHRPVFTAHHLGQQGQQPVVGLARRGPELRVGLGALHDEVEEGGGHAGQGRTFHLQGVQLESSLGLTHEEIVLARQTLAEQLAQHHAEAEHVGLAVVRLAQNHLPPKEEGVGTQRE